jgi:hypothetical protein
MWGAIAAGIGSVVGGVTNLVAASSQGTAMCGARPTCLFGKTCREKKENFEDCVQRTLSVQESGMQTQAEVELEKTRRNTKIAIFGFVTLAIIVLGVAIIKRRKK